MYQESLTCTHPAGCFMTLMMEESVVFIIPIIQIRTLEVLGGAVNCPRPFANETSGSRDLSPGVTPQQHFAPISALGTLYSRLALKGGPEAAHGHPESRWPDWP